MILRTDGQGETSIPLFNFIEAQGIIKVIKKVITRACNMVAMTEVAKLMQHHAHSFNQVTVRR